MRRILLFCFTSFFWVTNALAERYVVGVEDIDYLPMYSSEGGEYKGYGRELLDAFAEASGHTFEYQPLPIVRLTKAFLDGEVDFKFPDNPYWAQDAKKGHKMVYSEPTVAYTDGVLVLPKNKGKGLESLSKLTIVRGFTPWEYQDLIKEGKVSVGEVSSLDAMVKMVQSERTDGAYFNVTVAKYFLEQKLGQPDTLVFDSSLPHTQSNYFLSATKHPEVIEQFNDFLKNNAGLVNELKKKFSIAE